MLAERASEALRKTLLKNEVYGSSPEARKLVAELLVDLQNFFHEHNVHPIYLGELYKLLEEISEKDERTDAG